MTIKFKMTDKEIVAGIKSISGRSKSLRIDIHKILCAMTHNWASGGAVNVCAERMTAMIQAIDPSHKQKLINWANSFCSFTFETDDDGEEVFRYDSNKTKLSPEEWDKIKATTIFDHTPDKAPIPFNLTQKIKSIVDAAEKRLNSDKRTPEDVVSREQIDALKALLVDTEVEPNH